MAIGIDYGMGETNIDKETGIRYGVIPQNDVLQAWSDSSEAYYGKPTVDDCQCPTCGSIAEDCEDGLDWGDSIECTNRDCDNYQEDFEVEFPDFTEPISYYVEEDGFSAECGESGDIFVTKSPYYTFCKLCSPCAPGAGYLTNSLESMGPVPISGNAHDKCGQTLEGNRAYCFGHDWFEDNKAPYRIFSVETGEEVLSNPVD